MSLGRSNDVGTPNLHIFVAPSHPRMHQYNQLHTFVLVVAQQNAAFTSQLRSGKSVCCP